MKHFFNQNFCPTPQIVCRTDVGTYDISELYQFADQTGILERHRQMLAQPFQDSQVHSLIVHTHPNVYNIILKGSFKDLMLHSKI